VQVRELVYTLVCLKLCYWFGIYKLIVTISVILHSGCLFRNLLPDKSRRSQLKSPVIKRNCNPHWNHTFLFSAVSWDELRERSLELTIWDHDRLTSNDFLGGIRLNLGCGNLN